MTPIPASNLVRIEQANGLLIPPPERATSAWAGLGAAAFAAVSAIIMAGMMVLGPGITFDDRPPVAATGFDN